MTRTRQELGKTGEDIALEFLEKHGMRLEQRNFRIRTGEIDLVMWQGEVLVFVEVRTRSDKFFGAPVETVVWKKRRKIIDTARYFLKQKKISPEVRCRFDLVGIVLCPGCEVEIDYVPNAFLVGD